MGRVTSTARKSEPVQLTKPITDDQAARSTWASLPIVKTEPVVLEVKPLFQISGGGRCAK